MNHILEWKLLNRCSKTKLPRTHWLKREAGPNYTAQTCSPKKGQTSGPAGRWSEQPWSKPVDQLGGGPNSHGPNQWTSMEVVRTVPEHGPNQCQEMVKNSTRQKWSKPVEQLGDGLNSIRTRSRRSEQYQNKVQMVWTVSKQGPDQWSSWVVSTVPEHGPKQCQEMVKNSTRRLSKTTPGDIPKHHATVQ